MKKVCEECKFWRDKSWCSNPKSVKSKQAVRAMFCCVAFVKSGKKAPVQLQLANKVLDEGIKK